MKLRPALALLIACQALFGQALPVEQPTAKPGVRSVQVPFASLQPSATFKVGGTADWVLVADNGVWVATTQPFSLVRIDPTSNRIVARVPLPGEACSGLAFGFGSIWAPICGKRSELVRVDAGLGTIRSILPVGPAGPEGGIAASADSVWLVTDKKGRLTRIDPNTERVRQTILIPPGSYNPIAEGGIVWISGFESGVLTAVDASSGAVLESIPVGPRPRFLTAGGGSIWTLNQGDGTVSRVDEKSRRLAATIRVGIPGTGGDIGYGAGSVWPTVFGVPLTRIDGKTNKIVRQWVGSGGDSVRLGSDSLWLTDYKRGLLWRFSFQAAPSLFR